jgi:predicted RNase H-like HicB family nuclease
MVKLMEYETYITLEDGWYIADVPALPGCMSQGRTEEEAVENIKDAINGYLKTLRKNDL